MPKRQPKPEPITPDEVMGSPALQGFDTFLRYRSTGDQDARNGRVGESETTEKTDLTDQATAQPIGELPNIKLPIGVLPPGVQSLGELPVCSDVVIAEFRPGPKIRHAVKAQDGHSQESRLFIRRYGMPPAWRHQKPAYPNRIWGNSESVWS